VGRADSSTSVEQARASSFGADYLVLVEVVVPSNLLTGVFRYIADTGPQSPPQMQLGQTGDRAIRPRLDLANPSDGRRREFTVPPGGRGRRMARELPPLIVSWRANMFPSLVRCFQFMRTRSHLHTLDVLCGPPIRQYPDPWR
jgi:hypothetical protein